MSRSLIFAVVVGALAFGLFATISVSPTGLATDPDSCVHEPGSTSDCEHAEGESCGARDLPVASKVLPGAVASHGVSTTALSDKHEEQMLVEALRKKPDHVPVLLRMAGIAAAKRQYTQAIEHLNQAVGHDPRSVEVRLERGRVLFEIGKIPEAIADMQAILKDHPDNAEALYNLGAIYGNVGNREMAEKFWGKLIASKPESESGRRAKTLIAELRKHPTS
jgi:tetratricopeptide (TPR) repeat protein